MIHLLLGQDDFSKSQYITDLVKKEKAQTELFLTNEDLSRFSWAGEQDLFSKPKISVLKGLFKDLDKKFKGFEIDFANTGNLVIVEDKLDRRGALVKKMLSDKNVELKQFNLPHLAELNTWILKRIEFLGGKISLDVAEFLAKKIGRDDFVEIKEGGRVVSVVENYSLWQVDNEIKKLIANADSMEITRQAVEGLVQAEVKIEALEIANRLADNNRLAVLSLVDEFLIKESTGDVKAGIIQLSALLAEQFRNIVMIQDFLRRKLSDQQILDITSWRSGRLFMVKKAANNFSNQRVKDFLIKLQALDVELKSSTLPPRVLLDLILSQLLSTP